MVVSKLWLAGHLLPDLKPYTRRSQRGGSADAGPRSWERQAVVQGAGKSQGAAAQGGSGGGGGSGRADLPPLVQLVTSDATLSTLGGSLEELGSASAGSLLGSLGAGGQVGRRWKPRPCRLALACGWPSWGRHCRLTPASHMPTSPKPCPCAPSAGARRLCAAAGGVRLPQLHRQHLHR